MSSYIDQVLTPNERVLHHGHTSLWSLWFPLTVGVLTLPFFGFGLILLLWAFIQYKTTELAITNKRVIAKFGFISRRTIEINITKVESVQVDQSVPGRIFNFGTLVISGAGNPQAPIPGISNPMAFRKAFMAAQEVGGAPALAAGVRA